MKENEFSTIDGLKTSSGDVSLTHVFYYNSKSIISRVINLTIVDAEKLITQNLGRKPTIKELFEMFEEYKELKL